VPVDYDEEGNIVEHYNIEDAPIYLEDEASWIDEEGNEVVEQDLVRNYEDEFGNEVEEHTIVVKKPHNANKKSKKEVKGSKNISGHKDLMGTGDARNYRLNSDSVMRSKQPDMQY
jgi:hypothetical protein